MRRKHCEIKDPQEMIRILASTNIGRLATVDPEEYPYITPLNFVFHEGCVYFHCAPEGEKLDNLIRRGRWGHRGRWFLSNLTNSKKCAK